MPCYVCSGLAQLRQDCPVLTSIPYTLMKIVSLESFSAAMFAFQHTKYTAHNKAWSVQLIGFIVS